MFSGIVHFHIIAKRCLHITTIHKCGYVLLPICMPSSCMSLWCYTSARLDTNYHWGIMMNNVWTVRPSKAHGLGFMVSNLLWPNDVIWWHRSGSTQVRQMVCCMMTSCNYPSHCWINAITWRQFRIPQPSIIILNLAMTNLNVIQITQGPRDDVVWRWSI